MDGFENQEELFFGELLKQFRVRRKLTQQQLAKNIEAARETVSLWERGEYKPEGDGILYRIVDVLALNAQEQARLFEAYTVTALKTSFHQPPFKRNPYFTGRGAQLKTLHTLLMGGKQVALTQASKQEAQAISGLGGIGKTQLALEYVYRHQKSYHDIFWASADTEEVLMTSYVRFADVLRLPEAKEADQTKVKEAVHRWFKTHTNWLLVLDNIENLHLLPSFVPEHRQGGVLLTTRRQVTEPVAQALELEVLPEEDAVLFLLKRTKVLALDASLQEASQDEREAASVITRLLGNLPLALDQAGAYILEITCGFAEYAALFQTHREHLLQRRIGKNIPTDHPDPITTTFELNFQQVQQQSSAAAHLLRMAAFLSPDAIPEELFTDNTSFLDPILAPVAADPLQFNHALEVLRAYSLIRRNPTSKTLSSHRLVQAVLQDMLEEEEQRRWAERVVLAANAAFPHAGYKTWPQCERLLTQAMVAVQWIKEYQFTSEEAARLLDETASYLRDRGRYREAEPLYQRALHIWEQSLGPNHPDVASTLNNLANLYWKQGKYAEAEPLYQRALHIWEQSLGPNHPNVAHPLNGLANLHAEQGKYAEAEPLYQQALHIREQSLGPDHPDVARPLNNLAELYREQGKYAEAEPLYQRALHIWEQGLGPDHPDVAHPLNGLANLYREQGKYAEAEPLYQRALHIWEQSLGPNHTDVASTLNNLANLYWKQGKYAEAEPLYQQALHIREQSLGPDHPRVAHPLNNLAELYWKQGKYAEAEPLYQQALHIWEQSLGPNHPNVATTLNNLAELYREQGKYAEAEPLYQRALHIWEQGLGPDHPDVAHPLNGLANLYAEQGKYAEAEPLYQRALHIRKQSLGPDHAETVEVLYDLATFQERQGNHQEALSLYQRAFDIRERVLGPEHSKTGVTYQRLTTLRQLVSKEVNALSQDGPPPEQSKENT